MKDAARYIALGALFVLPLTPLIVAESLFFPFITGKAFYFRVAVEVAFGAWLVLALTDARYRPRFSWVGCAVAAFVLWMFVANFFAVNVEKAFWSNFERMEGWVLLAHLMAFFVVARSVLTVEGKWRAWFLTSLAVSLIVLGYAFLQAVGLSEIHQGSLRTDASFGNSIYLAIYLLFNTFIAGWLAFTEERTWLKWALFALIPVNIIFIFLTQTRGTILALVGSLALVALLAVFSGGSGAARRVAAGGLVALLLIVGGFVALRDTPFIRESESWSRLAHISLEDGRVRFTIWGMAWQGFLDRPITGWGQEGFNYVFNTYYEPSLYNQEQWFDRAHNAFIDWLIAGGLPAFLLYFSLFGAALFALWRSTLARPERIALTAALAGYAFHNLFVFDNLYSYVYFFALLALIDGKCAPAALSPQKNRTTQLSLAFPVVSVLTILIMYAVNVPGLRVASDLIRALSPQPTGLETNAKIFAELAARPAFASQEVREMFVNFALQVIQLPSIPDSFKGEVLARAATEMEKQVAHYPADARERLQLSLAYRIAGNLEGALREVNAALALSPRKEQIMVQKGLTLLALGDNEAARETFEAAYALGPKFSELAKFAALGNVSVGDIERASAIIAEHPDIADDIEAIIKELSALSAP